MRKNLLVTVMTVAIVISLAACAWISRNEGTRAEQTPETASDVTTFKAVINGIKELDISVCANTSDGLTEKEAELIVGTTFILVMGDYVTHRLDSLSFDNTQIEAHYTWGHDENDLGHICDITVDITTLHITVSHCF